MTKKITRRRVLQGTALAGVGAGVVFFGPWEHNRVYAAASDKPIKIGLTHDASGQFANSGQAEKRGTILAIQEANAKGGVLGARSSMSGWTPRPCRRPAPASPSA